jgi:hypothetical protein
MIHKLQYSHCSFFCQKSWGNNAQTWGVTHDPRLHVHLCADTFIYVVYINIMSTLTASYLYVKCFTLCTGDLNVCVIAKYEDKFTHVVIQFK